jgi:head-tail adaptor
MSTTAVGRLRQKVLFEKNSPINVATGGQVDNYSPLVTTFGYLRKKSGFRTLEGSSLVMNSTHELRCRYQQKLNEIDSSVRVVIGYRFFTVDSWEKEDEKSFWYIFQLKETSQ